MIIPSGSDEVIICPRARIETGESVVDRRCGAGNRDLFYGRRLPDVRSGVRLVPNMPTTNTGSWKKSRIQWQGW